MGSKEKRKMDREQKELIERIGRGIRGRQIQKRLKKVKPIPKPTSSLIAGMKVRKHCKPGPGYQKYLDNLYFQRKIERIYWKTLRVSHTNDKTFWGIFGG